MTEKLGFNIKAAVPLTDDYVQDCLQLFDAGTLNIDYARLVNDAQPVDFLKEKKTDYLVLRLSCLLIDPESEGVGLIWRSGRDHQQNPSAGSVLISSELIEPYTFLRQGNILRINRHHPFTEKLGAHLGAFDIEKRWWIACLRRQQDRVSGKMRYYAFLVFRAVLDKGEHVPSRFSLYGNVENDEFRGFWHRGDILRHIDRTRLQVDYLAIQILNGQPFVHADVCGVKIRPPDPQPPVPALSEAWPTFHIAMNKYHNTGQVGAMGDQAHAQHFSQQQTVGTGESIDLAKLATELESLRRALHGAAVEPEHDIAVAEVARATTLAKQGDEAGAVAALKKAGKWAWDFASKIGATLVAEVIKRHTMGGP